jgi:hypothetical protein
MDGVYDLLTFYQRGGFTPVHRHLRLQATASAVPRTPEGDVERLAETAAEDVIALVRRFEVAPRPAFIRAWLAQTGAVAGGIRRDGALAAYGLARPCGTGYKVGPLYAERSDDANALMQWLMAALPGQLVQIDVPDVNAAAL